MSSAAARRHYSQDGLGMVSNERILVMLYERLDRDLFEAATQAALGDRMGTHAAIMHAQDILYELIGALDVDAWEGAAALQELYVFCLNEIIDANITQDPARLNKCRDLLRPIGEAWREASVDPVGLETPQAGLG